jgi:MarR family transcriptional regulator, temperature-dependent positive regulator of motility
MAVLQTVAAPGAGMDKATLEIREMPGHLIRRLHQVSVSIFMEEAGKAGFDLTPVQYGALSTLRSNPAIDQATLAGLIAYDRVTIGGVVDRLVQKGLVRREINKRDRRARELSLTDEGERLFKAVTPAVHRVQALTLSGLDDEEREIFLKLLRKATDAANDQSRAPLRETT